MATKKANGMGYVFKRGNSWYGRIRKYAGVKPLPNGNPGCVQVTKGGFSTKREAMEWCISQHGIPKKEQHKTLLDYYNLWFENYAPKLSKSKRTSYATAWKRCESIHHMDVSSITVQTLCDVVKDTATTYNTARDLKVLLNKLFTLIGADGLNSKDLATYIQLPENHPAEQEAFTMQEVQLIYAYWNRVKDKISAAILLMIYSSMMPGELLGLKREMIDLDHRVIRGAGIKTKDRKKAPIVFPDFIAPVVQSIIDKSENDVLYSDYSEHRFYEEYHTLLLKIGVRDLRPYSCRHTTNTMLAQLNTIPGAVVAQVMRHSEEMNERYTHIGEEAAYNAVNLLFDPSESRQSARQN